MNERLKEIQDRYIKPFSGAALTQVGMLRDIKWLFDSILDFEIEIKRLNVDAKSLAHAWKGNWWSFCPYCGKKGARRGLIALHESSTCAGAQPWEQE